jgi:hypothetical protein
LDDKTLEANRAAREVLRIAQGEAFMQLAQILFEEDPIGINFNDNTDEYEPEAGTILPRLAHCETTEQIQDVLYSEFVRWFDVDTAGPRGRYRSAAERIRAEMVRRTFP